MNEPTDHSKTRTYAPTVGDSNAAPRSVSEPIAEHPARIGRYLVERLLGEGGYGRVYLARDEKIDRQVAIKVPHPHLIARPDMAPLYIAEARTAASLEGHAHIIPVYDVGSTPDYPCFIVSKYIPGRTLAARMHEGSLTLSDSVRLVATVAEALHHAHVHGVVHRDVKPRNILIDPSGKPYVADFGIALREQDIGKGPRQIGTTTYMSPEQARGEGHRVDGRSDIFSLGVVFYQLLTGRRPFKAESGENVADLIVSHDPRPPRQLDEAIPKELERVCLKAMSKRASDRYTTAIDMAAELRAFLEQKSTGPAALGATPETPGALGGLDPAAQATPALGGSWTAQGAATAGPPLRIVPKGLRSFDAHDKDFFLELLPGPRDREGLPDSIRFWKNRIEPSEHEETFSIGLLYGPSGCGKSSLVRAGLLPRLSADVAAIYIEATAADTENRLLAALRKRHPELPENLGLKETMKALRRSRNASSGKKVLIVLDQFEQWLHVQRQEHDTELVQALRHCDGARIQCLVMVRDDFWLAVSRFMRELEVRLLEGQNSALVDLFDLDHARKVLGAFGRAFEKLPARPSETTRPQKEFLKQAVNSLAQEGKVIPVRLALFAEMMKSKSWTPGTLREVGGAEGVGVNFLEDSFSSASAPPEHRYHQRAARAVLRALLPEAGADIKGHMRSDAELLDASGYSRDPKEFQELVRILDTDIRLITPTDPRGVDGDNPASDAGGRYYQLTHDYLVPSLRTWLARKQMETRRGRAELLLADRAAEYDLKPDRRLLPAWYEWLNIRLFTKRADWSPAQRGMMDRAGRYHIFRGVAIAAVILLAGWSVRGYLDRLNARHLRNRLLNAPIADVAGIVEEMAPARRSVDPLLHQALAEAVASSDAKNHLHLSLALLPVDRSQVDYLYERLLSADPPEFGIIRTALAPVADAVTPLLWTELQAQKADSDRRFRGACALALYVPSDGRWKDLGRDVAVKLLTRNPLVLEGWKNALQPAGAWLLPHLAARLDNPDQPGPERATVALLYKAYANDRPDALAELEHRLEKPLEPGATSSARLAFVKRQANIASALAAMGRTEKVWPLLVLTPDPTLRSYLIDRLASAAVEPAVLDHGLSAQGDASIRRALILALGNIELDRLTLGERDQIEPRLLDWYRNDPDPGVHGALYWTLSRWDRRDKLIAINNELATGKPEGNRGWYVNRLGQTMAVMPPEAQAALAKEAKFGGRISMGMTDVTISEFREFFPAYQGGKLSAPTDDGPANKITWYQAVEFCNKLNEKEGIPRDQWCYAPNGQGKYAEGMILFPNFPNRTGYRLPTNLEWSAFCRVGTTTGWYCGDVEGVLLQKYAWFRDNSHFNTGLRTSAVASLKPNDFGLFDMLGNVSEWCQDNRITIEPKTEDEGRETGGARVQLRDGTGTVVDQDDRLFRGGTCAATSQGLSIRQAPLMQFQAAPPKEFGDYYGFRIARLVR